MKKIICASTVGSFSKQYASLLALLILAFAGARTACALSINLNFNDAAMSSAGLSAGDITNVHNACAFAALQFTNTYSDNINVNISVTAVAGTGTLGQSNTSIFSFPYTTIQNSIVAEATSADDMTATGSGGSVATTDPVGGSHNWWVTRAQAKALGLLSNDATNDGTFTFGAGFSYAYDPSNRAVAGKFDFIGVAMHEFSEIMGRIPGLGTSIGGSPAYLLFDLFHYTGAGTRGLTDGAGRSFSINNGTALLKAFNNAAANGGDAQDWASGTNDAFNAFSNSGVQNDFTLVDMRVMDVIGYNLSSPAIRTLTVASSNPDNGVTVTVSPNDNNGDGSGTTQFTRTYNSNTLVTLTAPPIAGGNPFQKWQRDGLDWAFSTSTNVTMDANHTMTAVFSRIPQPDFDGDGKSDILWQNTSGARAVWLMNGTTLKQSVGLGTVATSWSIVGSGDFDQDGKSDILWQNTSGARAVWLMNGTTLKQSVGLGTVATSWTIVGSGDFDHDGKSDILWQNASGARAVWLMNGTTLKQSVGLGTVATSWNIVGSGDFDQDGKSDILWQNTSGARAIWLMNGTTLKQSVSLGTVAPSWTIVGSGDFDQDGKSDILWQNASGARAVWLMNGTTLKQSVGLGTVATSWNIRNF